MIADTQFDTFESNWVGREHGEMTLSVKDAKPKKPHRDFPLFPHATRRWAKKIRGKMHYFGPWHDPQGALDKYVEVRDDLFAGRTPRARTNRPTLRDLANRFLTAKKQMCESGELKPKTFADYYRTCENLLGILGKDRDVADLCPDDFETLRKNLGKKRGPVALTNEIRRARILFKFAFDQELIDRPIRYGQAFRKPSSRVMRQARVDAGRRMFESCELQAILKVSPPVLRAMVLLAINGGLGNTDIAMIPLNAIDVRNQWLNYPRPKTAIGRRIPIWNETIDAIKIAMQLRPPPKDEGHDPLLFLTRLGQPWVRYRRIEDENKPGTPQSEASFDAIGAEFTKQLVKLGLKRQGLGFYAIRRTFETIAGESRDQIAVNAIVGHAPAGNDMSAMYRERISDDRLRAVVEVVRTWLWEA
jgi:integrase